MTEPKPYQAYRLRIVAEYLDTIRAAGDVEDVHSRRRTLEAVEVLCGKTSGSARRLRELYPFTLRPIFIGVPPRPRPSREQIEADLREVEDLLQGLMDSFS